MKINKFITALSLGAIVMGFSSCKNGEIDFPDSDSGTTAYFAYQYPIRTLILGNVETYDNTSDNEGRFTIYGTSGGSYNGINAKITVKVDESLIDGLKFEDGTNVTMMPADYYTISGATLDYAGQFRGGVEIKLTDKFFADPEAMNLKYVIPVVMTDFTGVDSVLRGEPLDASKATPRQDLESWNILAKDYTIFAVNYINKYTATYLRRGVDKLGDSTIVRHKAFIEKDEVVTTTTKAMNKISMVIGNIVKDSVPVDCELVLTFNDNGECTIESPTAGFTVSGTGKYVQGDAKKAWGNKDRDALYLDYTLTLGTDVYKTKDTLVWRDRGTAPSIREYKPTYSK